MSYDELKSDRPHARSRLIALLVALFVAATPASAANPYKSKKLIAQLPADVGMDASRLHDTRRAFCGNFDPARPLMFKDLNKAVYHDCLVVEIDEGFAIFVYDESTKKWQVERELRPDNVQGARLVESGEKVVLRQLQFGLPDGVIFVFHYAGGLVGDNKRPLETIKRIEQLDFRPIEGVSYISPYISTTTTLYY